jgi:hypothetical protein
VASALAMTLTLGQAVGPVTSETFPGNLGVQNAEAVLYSPDTKVPRSADVALRRAIPAVNPSVKKIQVEISKPATRNLLTEES